MRNFVQHGEVIDWVNGTGNPVAAGAPVKIGNRVGVASVDIADGETGSAAVSGVFNLPKVSAGGIAQGADVYLTSGGNITSTASGNTKAGYCFVAAADGADAINVNLNR